MSAQHGETPAKAAVIYERDGPFVIEDCVLERPRTGEVLVRIVATGMCHTDAAVRNGDLPTPLPVVLGHEGAGVVEAVGAGVNKVRRSARGACAASSAHRRPGRNSQSRSPPS